MVLLLKKTTAALLAITSSIAFSGNMGPVCMEGNTSVFCQNAGWAFAGQALYFQPSFGHLMEQPALVKAQANAPHSFHYQNFSPRYNWGFKLEAAYRFNKSSDLNLHWYDLDNTNNHTYTNLVRTFSPDTQTGALNVNPVWDMVNLEMGQRIDFDEFKSVRVHGGVEYTHLAVNINGAYIRQDLDGSTVPSNLFYSGTTTQSVTYNGFGPRLGVDLTYHAGQAINIYANAAAALLAGSKGFTNSSTKNVAGVGTISFSASTTSVVPELDTKLGANYTYPTAQGDFTLDVGWMWITYFQALFDQAVLNADTSTFSTSDANFGLQGVYFGLKWAGDFI